MVAGVEAVHEQVEDDERHDRGRSTDCEEPAHLSDEALRPVRHADDASWPEPRRTGDPGRRVRHGNGYLVNSDDALLMRLDQPVDQRDADHGPGGRDAGGHASAPLGLGGGLRRRGRSSGSWNRSATGRISRLATKPTASSADHDEQRAAVGVGGQLARRALGVEEAVDDQRPGHAGRRPGGEQPAVDGADLEGAEQVAQVGRHGREAAAVEGQDHRGEQHEQHGRGGPDGRQQHVEHDADAEVDHVDRLAADHVGRGRPDEPAGHVERCDSRPTKPPAAAALTLDVSPLAEEVLDHRAACSRMPMPAVTLQNSTTQSSQNCGVLIALAARHAGGGDQLLLLHRGSGPSPRASSRRPGTRTVKAPNIMKQK